MGKKKHLTKKQIKKPPAKKTAEPIYKKQIPGKFKYIFLFPVLIAIIAGVYFIYSSYKTNGFFGFPLDDPWIHLTFAKNLVEYGSFSYFKNEIVTSGSTSPIYTFLLSLFYIIVKNEFIISYLPGITFGAILVYIMIKLSGIHFKDTVPLVILTACLVALQPRLNLINVSGMETSMFIFLIAASLYAYQTKKTILLGIFLGLTIWCRPDGFVLWIVIVLDYLIQKYFLRGEVSSENSREGEFNKQEIIKAFSIAIIFAAAYFIFNYTLSGSLLPNTYKAKLEYYQDNSRSQFLEDEVLKYFSQFEFMLIWLPFLIGVLYILKSLYKREHNLFFVYFLFIIGLIGAYYIQLPFAHRFGRYLMPVIPFYILISIYGAKIIFDFLFERLNRKRANQFPNFLFVVYVLAVCGFFINQNFKSLEEYTFFCKYHNDRHVAAGKWLKKNTDESDVIATHDIGAIAFYSERKLIDMAGLISPDLINHLNDRTYSEYMNNYLAKTKVNYLVTLKNWFEVVNDKPVFVPINEFEFLEVYKYDPLHTHIQPKIVSQLNQAAIQMLQSGKNSNAISYLNQSLPLDTHSSQTYFILGAAYETIKDFPQAEKNFNKALELYPYYAEAYYGLAKINFDLNKFEDSNNYVKRSLSINPIYSPAVQLQNELAARMKK